MVPEVDPDLQRPSSFSLSWVVIPVSVGSLTLNPSPPYALHYSQPWMGGTGLSVCARERVIGQGKVGRGEGRKLMQKEKGHSLGIRQLNSIMNRTARPINLVLEVVGVRYQLLSDTTVVTLSMGKEMWVADALSRKSRPKPLRVRALVMTIGLNLPVQILNAQVEQRKKKRIYGTEDLVWHGLTKFVATCAGTYMFEE
ncbi:hypothetical protein Tco_1106158 [Tanacetum coccineum]